MGLEVRARNGGGKFAVFQVGIYAAPTQVASARGESVLVLVVYVGCGWVGGGSGVCVGGG